MPLWAKEVYMQENQDIIGESQSWEVVKELVYKSAPHKVPIFITGSTGVGKGIVARMIHTASDRKRGPYVKLNCAAVAETLIESELFGSSRGAFTGAIDRIGCFEKAHNGTLFLDEIVEMKPEMQAKLLSVIEDMKVTRLGGTREIDIDVRIIAATNHNVDLAIQKGKLREDLWYRLGVVTIHIPSLVDRKQDVVPLFQHFMKLYGNAEVEISEDVERLLTAYSWPGNVREIENLALRAAVFSNGTDMAAHLASIYPKLTGSVQPVVADSSFEILTIEEIERRQIEKTLAYCNGNKTRAAELLGISQKTLFNKLNEYKLTPRE